MRNIHKLKNGMTLIHEHLDYVASAAYSLMIPGGFVLEDEDSQGASVVLAEMTSRAAANYNKKDFALEFDGHGINHGESAGSDCFYYKGSCLATEIDKALELTSSMVIKPTFPEDSFEGVRNLFLQELLFVEDSPMKKCSIDFNKNYFLSPYNRSSNGTKEGLEKITYQGIKDKWEQIYSPQNSILSVVGNVDEQSLLKIVDKYFSGWQGSDVKIPKFEANSNFFKKHIDFDSNQTQIILAEPSVNQLDKNHYVAKVANQILSGGMFGRLFEEVREKRGLCYSVYSSYSATVNYGRVLYYAGTTTERAQETLDVIREVVKEVSGTISKEEILRGKTDLSSAIVIANESTAAKSSHYLSDYKNRGLVRSIDEVKKSIDEVSISDLDEYFNKFCLSEYSILTLGKEELK